MATEPLLASYGVNLGEEPTLPGFYDEDLNMWVVESREGTLPLIELSSTVERSSTKTRREQEQEDEFVAPLQIATKTDRKKEREDIEHRDYLSQLLTKKKDRKQEGEDEARASILTERLFTKTNARRAEREDQGFVATG